MEQHVDPEEDLDGATKTLLQAQQRICISEGDPPMPASIENAICDMLQHLGAPGTLANGMNGCMSNYGTDIVNDNTRPDTFIMIGYFKAWSFKRECLNIDITYFNPSTYSHLHFAFAEIIKDY
ncbi:hypothetical protein BDW72DRAFT_197852 [Aspergillus terricola var. indicus]